MLGATGVVACSQAEPIAVCVYPTFGDPGPECEEVLALMEEEVSSDPALEYCYEGIERTRVLFPCKAELENGSFGQACFTAGFEPDSVSLSAIEEELTVNDALITMSCMYLIEVPSGPESENND